MYAPGKKKAGGGGGGGDNLKSKHGKFLVLLGVRSGQKNKKRGGGGQKSKHGIFWYFHRALSLTVCPPSLRNVSRNSFDTFAWIR